MPVVIIRSGQPHMITEVRGFKDGGNNRDLFEMSFASQYPQALGATHVSNPALEGFTGLGV